MADSTVDVVNAALSLCETSPITSLTENSTPARQARLHLDIVRQGLLRVHPWNFAKTYAGITKDPTAPAWKWKYAYTLPEKAVRVLEIQNTDRKTPFELARHSNLVTAIYIDLDATLYVAYIADVDDVTRWDTLFTEAMVGRLATAIAPFLGRSESVVQRANAIAERAFREARHVDSQEGIPEEAPDSGWETARTYGPEW